MEEQAKLPGKGLSFRIPLMVGDDVMPRQLHHIQQRVELIVGTPGRLIDLYLSKHGIELGDASMLVLDEMDYMLQRSFCDKVMQICRALSQPQVLMYSATISREAEKVASSMAKDIIVIYMRSQTSQNEFEAAGHLSGVKAKETKALRHTS